jgi:hypothetical protein
MENKYFKRAMACIKRSRDVRQAKLGNDHSSIADCYYNMGVILLFTNNLEDAREMINKAMAIKTKTSGEATMLVSKCLEILVVIDVQKGNIGDGLVYGKHAL